MPGQTMPIQGNVRNVFVLSVPLTPSIVNTITAAEQTFTVNGLQVGDVVVAINKPTAQAGVAVVHGRVSAANTLALTYVNPTAGNITPTAETYLITIFRPDNATNPPSIV